MTTSGPEQDRRPAIETETPACAPSHAGLRRSQALPDAAGDSGLPVAGRAHTYSSPRPSGVGLASSRHGPLALARDLFAASKPGLSLLVLCTTAVGLELAPHRLPAWRALLVLAATTLLVAAANVLNCILERDTDALMTRTRGRPFTRRRVHLVWPVLFSTLTALLALFCLMKQGSMAAAALGGGAFLAYVGIYTPLKRHTPWALLAGAAPGAVPPALGWISVTGSIDRSSFLLFLLLFLWQLPHFLAASVYLKDDYQRARLRMFINTHGERAVCLGIAVSTALLVPASLLFVRFGMAGAWYAVVAGCLGAGLLALALVGFVLAWSASADDAARRAIERTKSAGARWARGYFAASVVYLTGLLAALVAFHG